MGGQREYVCGFKYCLHPGEKVPSDIAIKDGARYLHPDCKKEKQTRSQIFDIYYKFYKTTEDYHMVRKAIKGFCDTSPSEYVLYVLCQAIHQKVPFKGIFTLGWLVKNDMEIKRKYAAMITKKATKGLNFENIETIKSEVIETNHEDRKKKSWTDVLFS